MLLKAISLIIVCFVLFVAIEIYFSRRALLRQAQQDNQS